jgi:hypothetical protein
VKSAGDAVVFEIVSFPVLDENVQAYELAVKVVPVFN